VQLLIDETAGLTSSELRARARRMARQFGTLGLIVIDYLQLMSGSSGSDENRATELGEISRGLKALAKELQCPVIALSQLNRSVETRTDKRPMMSDLRESGAIEQDADIIMFIYRDDYYNKENSKSPGITEIIIAKQRNGPVGDVKLTFLKPMTRFENLAPGSGGEY
jgi:replicative DNA helicase